MKNTLKRLLSLIIATFLILSFSIVPAFASSSPPTTWTPTSATAANTMKTITVNGVIDGGATVTAYQIVKGTYKDGKLTGYELCDSVNAPIANIEAPTSTEITNIANYIEGHPTAFDSVQMTYQNSSYNYTATVEAGEYIVLARSYIIESSPGTFQQLYVYNPGLVAVNVTDANLINSSSSSGGTLSLGQFLAGDTAYLKKNIFTFQKHIKRSNRLYNYGTATIESPINFYFRYISIPEYSQAYTAIQFTITDDLNPDGLENSPFLGVSGLKVILGTKADRYGIISNGIEVAAGEDTYTITYYDENGNEIENQTAENLKHAVKYKIEFADAFIRANPSKRLTVDYSSKLTTNAKLALSDYSSDFISNDTRATLRYSNDPVDATSYNEYSCKTRTYTFGIDAVGNGIQTYELNKVTQAGGTYTSVLDNNDQEITKKSPNALAGAAFTIYSNQAMTRAIGTATSDANGHIEFRGLGEGTYYLKETAAPSGYTLNGNNYRIVISLTYSSVYTLDSYSVTTYLMGETDTQIGSATYTRSVDDTTDPPTYQITPTVTPAEVVNTTLVTLPTTGGVGTIVISVVAGLGMAVFLTIFVICKKRSSKKN